MMTWIFHRYSQHDAGMYFPGAVMLAGAFLTIISAFLARLSLKKNAA
jgi:hypothetical protein